MVYPEFPSCRHRHCKEGEFPHIAESKLAEMKDSKHFWAQGGTKFKISAGMLVVSAAAVTGSVVDIARHSKGSQYAMLPSNI